jgi:vacuolar-type H+-ATPase subunit H
MANKPIDTNRVSQILRRFFCTKKNHISFPIFQKELKPVLNGKECERLFDFLIDNEHYLEPINKRFFKWTNIVREDSFSEDKVRDWFLLNPIQTVKIGPKEGNPKLAEWREKAKLSVGNLSKMSDTELNEFLSAGQKEFEERKTRREKEEKRNALAIQLNCPIEQLQQIAEEILAVL